jgi:hypothetical protein
VIWPAFHSLVNPHLFIHLAWHLKLASISTMNGRSNCRLRASLLPLLFVLIFAVISSIAQTVADPLANPPAVANPLENPAASVISVSPTVLSACGTTLLNVTVTGFPVGNVTFQLSSSDGAASVSLVRSIDSLSQGVNPNIFEFPKFALPPWPAASSFVTLSNSRNSLTVSMFVQPCWSAAAPATLQIRSSSPVIVYGSAFIVGRDYICRFTSSANASVFATSTARAAAFSLLSCSIPAELPVGGRYILGVFDSLTFAAVDRDRGIFEVNILEELSSVTPVDFDSSASSVVAVTGFGFSAASSYSCTLSNPQGSVIKSTSVIVSSSTALACSFPSWPYEAGPARLQLSRDNVALSNQPQVNFFASWTSVSPKTAPVAGGSYITVSGAGFILSVAVQCKFSSFGASSVLSPPVLPASSTSIVCSSPKWTNPTLSATLELVQVLGGQAIPFKSGTSSSFLFAFENWLLLSPISGPVTGGTLLTVSGAAFATDGSAQYLCAFQFNNGQSVTSPVATVVSSMRLTCQLPALADRPHGVALFTVLNSITGAVIGNVGSSAQFTFVPVITSYSPQILSITNASIISLSGMGFDVNKSYTCSFKDASSVVIGSAPASVSSTNTITCASPLISAFRPADATLFLTDGLTESNAVPVTFMPSLISIYPSVICYSPSASITVYGTGFAADEQYALLLNFQPVDGNFLQSTFPGTYTLPRRTASIRSTSNSVSSMLVFVLSSSDISSGAVDINVSLQSVADSRTFLNTLPLFPSLYGRSACASVSSSTGTSISAEGGTSISVSVSNGVYPKLVGSPENWVLNGVGLRNFQCVFASSNFVARSIAFVANATASSSNVVGLSTFQCVAPVWLSSATAVRVFIQFQSLFLPVTFYIGSVNDFFIKEAISSVSPSLVAYNGGRSLTVTGNGFVSDNTAYRCFFNNIQSSVTVLSSTALSCLSPVLSLPASMVFSVKYLGGAAVPVAAGVATTVLFTASILSVSSPQVFITSASVKLSIGGLNSIDATKYRCAISFISPPAVFELALDGIETTPTSVKCDTSSFSGYVSMGQINGGSASVTLRRLDSGFPLINGSASVTFLGGISAMTPMVSSNPSKFITVTGNGFIPGVNTAQVCSFQSTSDLSTLPITSATVGLTYTSSLVCEKPNLPTGQYTLSIFSGSQLIARTASELLRYTASAEWTSIAPTSFSAIGGSVFSISGSHFSLSGTYTVKFYVDEIYHYVSVVAVPISASILSGYSPAWPFPASQVIVSVEFQGSQISSFRQNVLLFPEISKLQTLPAFSGPFLYVKASGLSPIAYTCSISDARSGLTIQTSATLGNATSNRPYLLRPMRLISTIPIAVNPFQLLLPFKLSSEPYSSSPPFSPDFSSSIRDWDLKSIQFDLFSVQVPLILTASTVELSPSVGFGTGWQHGFEIPAVQESPAVSFLRIIVKLSSPENPPQEDSSSPEGIMVQCEFEILPSTSMLAIRSSYSVLLPYLSQVECSHSFRKLSTSSSVIIRVTACSTCKFRVAQLVFENRQLPSHQMPSTFMFGSQDIGCKGFSPSFFGLAAQFDSFKSSAFREQVALCVINNTDTALGGAVALMAKVDVSSVNRQYDANASVSYRVLFRVTPNQFLFPDPSWSASSTSDSSLSSILRKMWFLAEPVTAALNFGALPQITGATDMSTIMPIVSASNFHLESNQVSKLDFTTLACDTSSVTEGQKSVEISPSLPSYFGFEKVRLSVRVLPSLSVLSLRIPAEGTSKFLFEMTGLDPNFIYQLTCSFRSTLTSKSYSSMAISLIGYSSIFTCVAPAVDASSSSSPSAASWTFSVSSATANFNIFGPSQVLVIDQLRVNTTSVSSATGRSVPVSFAFSLQESFVCKLSAPLSVTPRSLELVGGAYATIPAPSLSYNNELSISLWMKASPAAQDDKWTDVLALTNGFSISIARSGQSLALGNSARVRFCARVLMGAVSSDQCIYSAFLPITNVWVHIFASVKGASGDILLAINGQLYDLKVFQFNLNFNSALIVLGQNPLSEINAIPFEGIIDNVRVFTAFAFVPSNLFSELFQRSFSSYPPSNMIMSLTFDDDNGRDEVSGQTISIQKTPFSSMKGQWYSDCLHLASGNTFSYSTLYNETHYVFRLPDSAASSWTRYIPTLLYLA